MPRAARVCPERGCASLITGSARYCPTHTRERRQAADAGRPSSAARGYDGQWQKIRAAHLRDHTYCVMCMEQGVFKYGNHVDHIVAKKDGGTDDPANLQTLCHSHHSQKTATFDGGFGNKKVTDVV